MKALPQAGGDVMMRLTAKGRIFIIALLLALGAAAADARLRATERLSAILARDGLYEGVNPGGKVVAVARANAEKTGDIAAASDLSRRNALHKEAELRARVSLLTLLAKEMSAARGESLSSSDGVWENSLKEALSVRVDRVLRGSSVLCSSEVLDREGDYTAAVAIGWDGASASSEMMCDEKPSTAKARNEWAEWAKGTDLSCKFGTRKFIGSDGLLRYAGLGFADIEGVKPASSQMKALQKIARDQARSSLALAIGADVRSQEMLVNALFEKGTDSGGCESSEVFTSLLSRIEMETQSLVSNAPEVHSAIGVDPITGHRLYISVCGWEPWQLEKLLKSEQRVVPPCIEPVDPGEKAMKMWNPVTLRFE